MKIHNCVSPEPYKVTRSIAWFKHSQEKNTVGLLTVQLLLLCLSDPLLLFGLCGQFRHILLGLFQARLKLNSLLGNILCTQDFRNILLSPFQHRLTPNSLQSISPCQEILNEFVLTSFRLTSSCILLSNLFCRRTMLNSNKLFNLGGWGERKESQDGCLSWQRRLSEISLHCKSEECRSSTVKFPHECTEDL